MEQKRKFAILRISFGLVWAIDAYFKWQSAFFTNFTDYLSGNLNSQPELVQHWLNFWIHLIGISPHFFALIVALSETAIAIGLLFGFLTRAALLGGIGMSFVIWSTAESFGGPYVAGSTDIGAAVIYILVFIALLIGRSGEDISVDNFIKRLKERKS